MKRRRFLGSAAVLGLLPQLPAARTFAAGNDPVIELETGKHRVQVVPEQYGETAVWCFNKQVPGPEIRARQGDRLRVRVMNGLEEGTTVHWHGIRLPNDMDGVPNLTQDPIRQGEEYFYEFDLPDAGTYWYHPHHRSMEQVGRGLHGPLIVEEANPPQVDRDVTWVMDDWRLQQQAQIVEDFGNGHDLSHGGRIGNTVTINGRIPGSFDVRGGERIRLRLINAANARIFSLGFSGHQPKVIAIDGHPVTPHDPANDRVVIAPGMRIDLILDMTGKDNQKYRVIDDYYRQRSYFLVDLAYSANPLRIRPPDLPIQLESNSVPDPDPGTATRYIVNLSGGAMGRMDGAMVDGDWQDIRTMAHNGRFWAINGIAASGHVSEPFLRAQRGESVILELVNDTAWPHPMHLHGHSFRVLSRNGVRTRFREWQDTVLVEVNETVEIAFVADNPGDWMFHCHILEHQASGMMAVIRVA